MDFKSWKKIADGADTAVFKHANGSELKISKKALSPKHANELSKLPLYSYGGNDTEGVDDNSMSGTDSPAPTGGSPIVINVGGGQPAPTAAPAPAPVAPPAPQTGLAPQPQAPAPTSPDRQPAAQPEPNAAPEGEQASAPAEGAMAGGLEGEQPQADPKQVAMTHYVAEDQAFQNDLNNGHITPKTYSDLFHEKGTLGKIGTLFGLMLSGAGSGLTHQPNALLHMMDQQIANDLEGQKASSANAQNFLRLNQAHQMQQAQFGKMGAETSLLHAEAGQKAFALAQMQMNRAAFHTLVQSVQKLPPGSPQRQQAEQTLGILYSAINNENFNIADRAASASVLGGFGMQGGAGGEGEFQKRDRMLRLSGNDKLADDMEAKHMPGFSGQASQPIPQEIRSQLTAQKQYDEKAREYVEFAKKHQGNWANLNPVERLKIANQGASMAANLQSLYRNKIKGGVYKAGEQSFIEGIIPSQPAKWSASFNAIPKVEQTIHDNTNDMATTAKGVGLSAQGGGKEAPAPKKEAPAEAKSGPAEGATGTHNGKPVVYKSGKWSYR